MNKDFILIITEWIITTSLLVKYPKEQNSWSLYSFFFKQKLTWVLGFTVVQLKLIEYPVRLFPYATKSSFSFEYFVYPSLCALFNVHYPEKKSTLRQFMYYFYYCTSITLVEVFVEKHTNILKYIHWTWYITYVTLFITFYMTRKYYEWFFKLKK